ncbi:unnamed protein product [marine sediment metagenome]|uniref:Uncharacterized protein n=1 Tax=marine sediment metagenome TaxID=412755 RepID=X0WP62_9ZZZZ
MTTVSDNRHGYDQSRNPGKDSPYYKIWAKDCAMPHGLNSHREYIRDHGVNRYGYGNHKDSHY